MKRRIYKLLAVVTFVGAASSATAAPRTLENGAPAPGNTVAKGKKPAVPTRAAAALHSARDALAIALSEEIAAAQALSEHPRVLANGAPACGNTGGKLTCTVERSDDAWKSRVQRLVQAGVAVRASQAQVATLTKQHATSGSTADPDLIANNKQTADLVGTNR